MRTRWSHVLAVGVTSLLVTTSACSGDSSDSDGPVDTPATTSSSSSSSSSSSGTGDPSTTAAAGDRCAQVSAEDLSTWTGAAFTVEADGDDACTGVAADFGPYAVSWSFKASSGRFADDVQDESLGLEQRPVDLAGGVRGAVLQGDVSGTRVVRLLAPVGQEVLVVEVMNNDGTTRLGFADLTSVATSIAEQYL